MTEQLARNSGPLLDVVEARCALESASLKIHMAVGFIRLGRLPFRRACIIDRAELICNIAVLISKASTGAR